MSSWCVLEYVYWICHKFCVVFGGYLTFFFFLRYVFMAPYFTRESLFIIDYISCQIISFRLPLHFLLFLRRKTYVCAHNYHKNHIDNSWCSSILFSSHLLFLTWSNNLNKSNCRAVKETSAAFKSKINVHTL